jgi:septal ring factor EnvC (AmiA/AmiB activator)
VKWLLAAALFACASREPQLGPQVSTAPTADAQAAPAKPPRTSYERLEAMIPGVLDALEKLGASLRAANGDCKRLAKTLRAFADKNAALLPELGELMAKLSQQEREKFELDHHDDRERLETVFAATRFDCPGDTEVAAALEAAGFRRRAN